MCERGAERSPSAGAVATEAAIGSRRGRASRASSGIRRYLMLLPRTTSSGSFQKRSPSREVQITSRRQMFIQLSQLTRWPLYVSPFLSSTSIGCPCDVRRSESGSTIPPPDSPSSVLSLCAAESSGVLKRARWRRGKFKGGLHPRGFAVCAQGDKGKFRTATARVGAEWSHHHCHHHFHHRRRHWTTGWSHCAWLPWVRRSCAWGVHSR